MWERSSKSSLQFCKGIIPFMFVNYDTRFCLDRTVVDDVCAFSLVTNACPTWDVNITGESETCPSVVF